MKKIVLLIVLTSVSLFSQEVEKMPKHWFKVMLEGQPVYMNILTGAISTTIPNQNTQSEAAPLSTPIALVHHVEKGETLSKIARKYKKSLTELYRLNNLTKADALPIGKEIIVGYKQKAINHIRKQSLQEEASISKLTKVTETPISKPEAIHYVKKGETLFRLSVLYKISVTALKKINDLTSNEIFVGQKLRIH